MSLKGHAEHETFFFLGWQGGLPGMSAPRLMRRCCCRRKRLMPFDFGELGTDDD